MYGTSYLLASVVVSCAIQLVLVFASHKTMLVAFKQKPLIALSKHVPANRHM